MENFVGMFGVVLLVGCSSVPEEVESDSGLVMEEKVVVEEPVEELVEEPVVELEPEPVEEEVPDMFLKEGESMFFEGHKIILKNLYASSSAIEATVDVDGIAKTVYASEAEGKLINGVIVGIGKYDFKTMEMEIQLENLVLGDNEYLFKVSNQVPLNVFDKTVKLRDILASGIILFDVPSDNKLRVKIEKDKSRVIVGLKVTNVRPFYDSIVNNRAAVVKIEQA